MLLHYIGNTALQQPGSCFHHCKRPHGCMAGLNVWVRLCFLDQVCSNGLCKQQHTLEGGHDQFQIDKKFSMEGDKLVGSWLTLQPGTS